MAEIANRLLLAGGPALLFENVKGASMPLAINVMGTVERVCWAMNMDHVAELETLGEKLALLYQPRPPKKFSQAINLGKALFDVVKAKPMRDLLPPCQQVVLKDDQVDLTQIPLLRVYPDDADRVITLGIMITKDPENGIPNVGGLSPAVSVEKIRRRCSGCRCGAAVATCGRRQSGGQKLEVAIAIGVDPLLIMAAATPPPHRSV